MDLTIVIIRTLILYLCVTVGIRLMGKRQIGDMQPNELVVTLLISEIAAIPLQDSTQPIISGIIAISILVITEIFLSVISMKSFTVRKLMSGKSVIIIQNGVIDQNAMRKVRLTVIDLIELLRGQNIFDIDTVAFAVLEVNGSLSVLLKNPEQPATLKAVSNHFEPDALPLPVISDGKIVEESLAALKITKEDIERILKKRKLTLCRVFLMTLDKTGNDTVIEKGDAV